MKPAGQSATFGRRKEPHTVIIARGDDIKHFTVKPWMASLVGSAVAAMAIGYLLATSYLVLRDDLIGAAIARQARMQQAYEDRISALRAQVDRITSRQLLDQQLVESKVSKLLERQSQLSQRHGRLGPLFDRAGGVDERRQKAPVPARRPETRADLGASNPLAAAAAPSSLPVTAFWSTRNQPADDESAADRADKLFVAINKSLHEIESEQMNRVSKLAIDAYQTADTIAAALEAAGLAGELHEDRSALGGPLVPLTPATDFESRVKELDEALSKLETVKSEALRLPISNPAPGRSVTSTFGPRRDPLLGTMALHSGMDFRSSVGSPVRATGAGKVVHAGWNGGYGRMVEIDHGNGLTTRFAHMSKVLVKDGQTVDSGDLLGKSGNSGRSTGPHLHYEVRRNGQALDPLPFIKAGRKIGRYLAPS